MIATRGILFYQWSVTIDCGSVWKVVVIALIQSGGGTEVNVA